MSLSIPQDLQHQPYGPGLYIRSNRFRDFIPRELFKVEVFEKGQPVDYELECTHERARLSLDEDRWAEIRFTKHTGLRILGQNLGVKLTAAVGSNSVAYAPTETCTVFNLRRATRRYACECLAGLSELQQQAKATDTDYESSEMSLLLSPGEDGRFELAMDEFWSTWNPPARESAEELSRSIREEFDAFLNALPAVEPEWQDAAELATYVLWSCTQSPSGQFIREPVFMSLNVMDQVWSWDHCFNAMALAEGHPGFAWDQWQLPFDLQDDFGAIPDGFNDVFKHFNFCKPPVHGWTVLELLNASAEPSVEFLQQAFEHLSRHTEWFLTHRTLPGMTLPYYLHGNDSGWDNSTMFDQGVPLMAPDLTALLVVQCEALADLAEKLSNHGNASLKEQTQTWHSKRNSLLEALIHELWDGDCFRPLRLVDGKTCVPVESNSLIPFIPIFLGRRLPEDILTKLATGLERFVTDHGIATEAPDSPEYTEDGYWRGPVWAPSTYIIYTGLKQAGFDELAERIRQGFLRTCEAGGFAENFNALTGAPLRDKAYTWTASVFLLLARPLS